MTPLTVSVCHGQKKIIVAFSDRNAGDMKDFSNLRTFISSFGLSMDDLILAEQVHASTMGMVTSVSKKTVIGGVDGLFYLANDADAHSFILGVKVADCIPVALFDEENGTGCILHAGWKGLLAGIVTDAISKFTEVGVNTSRIRVVVGPHIRKSCYIVSKAMAYDFQRKFGKSVAEMGKEGCYLDLTAVLHIQLARHKIGFNNIFDSGECTSCLSHAYFSHRRGDQGRQIGLFAITNYNK